MPRATVATFSVLLNTAREVESALQEAPRETINATSSNRYKGRSKCAYCRNLGHGAPGVFRRDCPNCKQLPQHGIPTLGFKALSLGPVEPPALEIEIAGVRGFFYLDSGARTSLASQELYRHMQDLGFPFETQHAKVILDDGIARNQVVQTTQVPVTLKGRTFVTPFVYITVGPDSVTLLGVDFAQLAGLVVNYRCPSYYSHGQRHEVNGFVQKDTGKPLSLAPMDLEDLAAGSAESLPSPPTDPGPLTLGTDADWDKALSALYQSDEWSDLTTGYGPILSPLPTSPLRRHPEPLRVLERLSITSITDTTSSRPQFMWNDAIQMIEATTDT